MREILFRGKHKATGKWCEGNLNICKQGVAIITPGDTPLGCYGQVDPDTVGQYTGLTDKNGRKIFEGDIVDMGENWWDAAGPAGHDSQKTIVYWSEEHCGFDPFADYDCDCCVYIQAELCTVIGNIHDNPEILDGGDNNDK